MGRKRTIEPEFGQSRSMRSVTRDARLLFVLLLTRADDAGRLRVRIPLLAALLYPADGDAEMMLTPWLDELERVGSIKRYIVDGDQYLHIVNWRKWQMIDRPTPSRLPAPCGSLAKGSRAAREESLNPLEQHEELENSRAAREEKSDGMSEIQPPRELTKESALADLDRIQRDAERLKIFTPAIRALELKMRLALPTNGQDNNRKGGLHDDNDIPNVADVVRRPDTNKSRS